MDSDDEEIKEEGLELDDDILDLPPEGMGEDFGLEDPDDKYH
jgi:hypothetical protein